MFLPRTAFFLLSAAGLVFTANFAFAEDVLDDKSVNNLSPASPDYTISGGKKLTVTQSTDDVYSGTLLGSGALIKQGVANLTLDGASCTRDSQGRVTEYFSGYIDIAEGALTIGTGFDVGGHTIELKNSATLIFSQNGDFDGSLFSVNGGRADDRAGVVENIGSGKMIVGSSSGSELYVRAGVLVFDGSADFRTAVVSSYAELCVGAGKSSGALSGNVSLESNSILRFDVNSSSACYYTGTVSGAGSLVFDGESTTYFSADQTYTGDTTINAGTLLFYNSSEPAKVINIASPRVTLDGGSVGGNAVINGSVDVKGKYFSSTSSSSQLGGSVYLGLAGTTLTVRGDVTYDPWQLEVVTAASGAQSLRVADYGGVTQVVLSESGCGRMNVEGTVNLAGTLILASSGDLAPGQVRIFLDAENVSGDFDYVINSSDNVMLVTNGVMGLGKNQYGIASVENKVLRDRPAFKEHNGISNFVDYIASQTEASRPNEVGQAVNLAMGSNISDTVNNFSPLPYSALLGMGVRESNLEVDYLRNILKPGLPSPYSKDGIYVENNMQFFASLLTEFVNHRDEYSTPIYDFQSVGVIGGGYSWIDSERLFGASVAVHRSTANTHGYGGELADNAARLRVFAGFMPKNSDWSLILGASVGGHYYDINRNTGTGQNTADEFGIDAGAFVAFNYRESIAGNYYFTPYARFDFNHVRVDTVREGGSMSALEVGNFSYNSYRIRFGAGFERMSGGPGEVVTVGCDIGIVTEMGKDPMLSSHFVNYSNSSTSIRGAVEERAALEIAPRINMELGDKWHLDASFRAQLSIEGTYSNAFMLGITKTF